MRPIEHFIIAIFPIGAYALARDRVIPLNLVAVAFFGSQFPDLVDKPLAHQVSLIPSGRVFIHSLPIAVPIMVVVIAYAYKTERTRLGTAFNFAYGSHLVADNHTSLLSAEPSIPSDLLWPFRAPQPRPEIPYWAGPDAINLHLWTAFSVVVLSIAAYYVLVDIRRQLAGPGTAPDK